MEGILIKCMLLLIVFAIVFCDNPDEADVMWLKYKTDHNKFYSNEEDAIRRKMWEESTKEIEKHNEGYKRGDFTYSLDHNQMSDWTEEMFKEFTSCTLNIPELYKYSHSPSKNYSDIRNYKPSDDWNDGCDVECKRELPKEVDWRKKGIITPVKNQASCGACYAFGTIGAVEAQYALHTGRLIRLSEQELVDCSLKFGNKGCESGWHATSLKYIIHNKGINPEEDYRYREKRWCCWPNKKNNVAAVSKYVELKKGDEEQMKAVVARKGPVVATLHISKKFYKKKDGVYNNPNCSRKPTHAVVIVGYGEFKGTPYWLIKNSWGKKWGMEGYGRLMRNAHSQCGIADHPLLPIM